MKNSIYTVFSIFVFSCGLAFGQSNTPTRFVKFSGIEDAQTGTSKILNALKSNGETVKKLGDEGKLLLWEKKGIGKSLLELKVDPAYCNRIIVSKIYTIKFSYKYSDAVKELVWNANRQLSVGSYSITSDGDLMIQGGISFLDTLDLVLLEKYCRLLDSLDLSGLTYLDEKAMDIFETTP